jgi:hypothetical protein
MRKKTKKLKRDFGKRKKTSMNLRKMRTWKKRKGKRDS